MAYEKRISDWSSDVCSSDLRARLQAKPGASFFCATRLVVGSVRIRRIDITPRKAFFIGPGRKLFKIAVSVRAVGIGRGVRSEERRGGKGDVRTCRYRWATDYIQHKEKLSNN